MDVLSDFYVIAVVSNPVRYASRYRLFSEFKDHMRDMGAQLLVVEQAFGQRPFLITERDREDHLQFRADVELWHKENMINLGIEYLCQWKPDWKYVAWIDADVTFQRRDIMKETVQQLQHYDFVQMWSHVADLGPQNQIVKQDVSFMYQYHQNGMRAPATAKGLKGYYGANPKGYFWHPGYAWAARRSALDKVRLFDKGILGASDHHMAMALVGRGELSVPSGLSSGYYEAVRTWERLANIHIRRNVGFVPGTITHGWHGPKTKRKYTERWEVLRDSQFDPHHDLVRDAQGLYRLNDFMDDRSIRLRDDIRLYFRDRDEDSTSLE